MLCSYQRRGGRFFSRNCLNQRISRVPVFLIAVIVVLLGNSRPQMQSPYRSEMGRDVMGVTGCRIGSEAAHPPRLDCRVHLCLGTTQQQVRQLREVHRQPLPHAFDWATIRGMGFNRRKMEDERRREADKQAAARRARNADGRCWGSKANLPKVFCRERASSLLKSVARLSTCCARTSDTAADSFPEIA
jgi:hypothetical protein